MAKAKVTVGSNPSGTKATIIPIANTNEAMKGKRTTAIERIKNKMPIPTAIYIK